MAVDSLDPAPPCIQCGYDLTGLESARCPECGWTVDWERAKAADECRRSGTPVYQAVGRRRVLAIPATILLMLFRPVRFARRLRADEPIWPAALVAILSFLFMWLSVWALHERIRANDLLAYALSIAGCIAVDVLVFAVLAGGATRSLPAWPRIRLMLLASFYSTCFVLAWSLTAPPVMESWSEANFIWPLNKPGWVSSLGTKESWAVAGRSLIMYWWAATLITFALVRIPLKWRALLYGVVPFVAAVVATQIGARIIW